MKVLFVTTEALPFAKTGGLGDVSAALPSALAAKRAGVRVIMPLYGSIPEEFREKMKFIKYIYVPLAWRNIYCGLFELKHQDVTYYFVDNEHYFKRGELYGHYDDCERFSFFSKAVVSLLPEINFTPNVLHCNDWQTALVPVYLKHSPYGENLKCVFTIHNIEYQGNYSPTLLGDIVDIPESGYNTMYMHDDINLMKAAIETSDAVTTVSPTYAEELQYAFYAKGLEGIISSNREKLSGILNGIDMEGNDPATDKNLVKNFSPENLKGKTANKLELQKLLGLTVSPDIPMVAMVSRLVNHKGIDLVANSLNSIMDMELQLVIIGRGDWQYEQRFMAEQKVYPGRLAASISYNENLARKFYAGADLFLMPSRAEPCGLSQMIAMRYGAVPIVRETGGLRDTVTPYNAEDGTGLGFTFANINSSDLLYTLRDAVKLYHDDRAAFDAIRKRGMGENFGWAASASKYLSIYRSITGVR